MHSPCSMLHPEKVQLHIYSEHGPFYTPSVQSLKWVVAKANNTL